MLILLNSAHHQRRSFSPVCKACLVCAASICPYHLNTHCCLQQLRVPRILFRSQN
ncbi:hypothetical protein BJV77DRAFT_1045388 [Russula vinacea]|nr:hypothetical protein BJV77DRAFT_1045388 [Russula vinacea]